MDLRSNEPYWLIKNAFNNWRTFKPDYIWAGTFSETKDGLPFIGRPKPEINEHYVLGFGGNGITYSVMAMDAINDSIHHTHHPFLDDYRFDR